MLTTKPTLDINSLIKHIESKYSITVNSNNTYSYLNFINYDLLSPYLKSTQGRNLDIEQVIKYYDFDRKLKLLLWDGLERIEIALRTVLTNHMFEKSCGDEQWLSNPKYYALPLSQKSSVNNNLNSFETLIQKLIGALDKNRDNLRSYLKKHPSVITFQDQYWTHYTSLIFHCMKIHKNPMLSLTDVTSFKSYTQVESLVTEFINNAEQKIKDFFSGELAEINKYEFLGFLYSNLKLPFYLIVNDLTFFEVNQIIKCLKPDIIKEIATKFSPSVNEKEFTEHIEHFRKLRNIIAHHSPLCMCKLSKINNFSHFKKYNQSNIKSYSELIIFYLDMIAKRNTLKIKIENLINSYNQKYQIDFTHLGFNTPPF